MTEGGKRAKRKEAMMVGKHLKATLEGAGSQ